MKLLCRTLIPGLNIECVNLTFKQVLTAVISVVDDHGKVQENRKSDWRPFITYNRWYIPCATIHSVHVLNKHFAEVNEGQWYKRQLIKKGKMRMFVMFAWTITNVISF